MRPPEPSKMGGVLLSRWTLNKNKATWTIPDLKMTPKCPWPAVQVPQTDRKITPKDNHAVSIMINTG